MPKRNLSSLGTMVRKKRGENRLRETADDIGISPATLMRVENGRIPDLETFGKLCNWLKVNPGDFLGYGETSDEQENLATTPLFVTAHLKADKTPKQETVNALAKMILLAIKSQYATEDNVTDENS